jgi:hypothetical protein
VDRNIITLQNKLPHKRPHTPQVTTPDPTDIWRFMAYTADKAPVTRPRHRPWTGLPLRKYTFDSLSLSPPPLMVSPQSKFVSWRNTLRKKNACFSPRWVDLSPFSQPWRVHLIGTLKCLVKCDISSIRHAWNKGWFCRLVSFLTCFGLTGICFVPLSSIRFCSFPSWSSRFTVALLGSLIGFPSRSIQIYSHFVVRFVLIFVHTYLISFASDLISQFIGLIRLDIVQFGLNLNCISSA